MTTFAKTVLGAALATAALAPLPAAAQVDGIATTSPEIVIARAAATPDTSRRHSRLGARLTAR